MRPTSDPATLGVRRGGARRLAAAHALVLLASLYLGLHLPWLPRGLEDIDSVNFALGLRDFDPVLHQPHPPGYPVYVALGKASRAAVRSAAPGLGTEAIDALALAGWSAVSGAIAAASAAWLLFLFGRAAMVPMPFTPALIAGTLLAACPLFWTSGLRPLSDMPGLAAALLIGIVVMQRIVQPAALEAPTPAGRPRAVTSVALAAALGGLAIGLRSQLLWLVVPPLAAGVLARGPRLLRILIATAAFGLGALIWAVPLVAASGGLDRYLAALGTIAGEDFSEVPMLWMQPSARTLAIGLYNTFVIPWGHPALGGVVLAAATAGAAIMTWRHPRVMAYTAVAFGPYFAFHLLFQDTEYTRYALPLLVPVAWCAAWGLSQMATRFAAAGTAVLVGWSLALAVPVMRAYAHTPMPTSAVVAEAGTRWAQDGGLVAGHFDFARSVRVSDLPPTAVLPMPRFGERAELGRYFTGGGEGPVWFVASPLRTDLHLVDPSARVLVRASDWPFSRRWFLGGTRPAYAELVRVERPGWIAAEGWHLTREEINFSAQRGNPTPRMHVRSRSEGAVLFLGGEFPPPPGLAPATMDLVVTFEGRELASLSSPAGTGRFFHRIDLRPGALLAQGPYGELTVEVRPGEGPPRSVQFTHFDLQPPERPFWVYSHGWHDREWDRAREAPFRWASERASLRVHAAGRDLQLRIVGEAPVEALGGVPTITLTAGGLMLHQWRADGPFTESVRLSRADIARADGLLEVASDRLFVPGGIGGDPRRLAVRVDNLTIYPVGP